MENNKTENETKNPESYLILKTTLALLSSIIGGKITNTLISSRIMDALIDLITITTAILLLCLIYLWVTDWVYKTLALNNMRNENKTNYLEKRNNMGKEKCALLDKHPRNKK